MTPADALGSLLVNAGLAAQHLPPGGQARAARWRDWVAGKKILLLLDDAAGHRAGSAAAARRRRQPGAGHQPPSADRPGRLRRDQPRCLVPRRGSGLAGPAGGPARHRRRGCGGRRGHPAVRVPAAGDRDARPAAEPAPRLDRGGPGRQPGRGPGPARRDARGVLSSPPRSTCPTPTWHRPGSDCSAASA